MEKITLRNGTTIIITQGFNGWEATTEENYNAPIKNARNVMKFSDKEFASIKEVKQYLFSL